MKKNEKALREQAPSVESLDGKMTLPPVRWRITQDATTGEASTLLLQDPVWNCFALADLEPPLREYSQFAIASQEDSDEFALCLILRHPSIGQVLSPFGSTEGLAALLPHLALPERPLIQAQEAHMLVLHHAYQPETAWKRMLRMAITPPAWRDGGPAPHRPLQQLTASDVPALKHLYAQYPESMFSANRFTQGLYFGAYEGERIIAAGGTHALAPTYRMAVLGNILTASHARRQGYATAITAALVATLFEQQFSAVVLNVFEDNSPAIRIYERLGFQTRHRLLTGTAILTE